MKVALPVPAASVALPGRRSFLAGGVGLMVSLALPVSAREGGADAGPSHERLDSWLAVDRDGMVTASVGKIDAGLGMPTALAQIVADELDVSLAQVRIRMGDTATTVDQRGTGSSNGIVEGGSALRVAAAQARVFLLAQAAARLDVPVDRLDVQDGVVRVAADPSRTVRYADLMREGRFDIAVDPKASVTFKDPRTYRYVGEPVARADIAEKAKAEFRYLVDFRLDGMVHARVIRPPTAGAALLGVERPPKGPGFIRLVTLGNFAAVVCEREEQAVAMARDTRLRWSASTIAFPADYDTLYATLRNGPAKASKVERNDGDVDAALREAVVRTDAWYEYPFQSHASMGPACAVARIDASDVTVWMGGQKPYPLRHAVAELLGRPTAQVRVIWMPGPGSYGMNDADDAAIDAVLIAREVGRPVRLQYMRADATAWDPKGPPGVFHLQGGLDAEGRCVALDYHSRGYSGRTRPSGTGRFGDSLASQLIGGYKTVGSDLYQTPDEAYVVPNKRIGGDLLAWESALPTGLRTAHLRDPDGMATCFATESFVDEMAFTAKVDPLEFRLRHLTEPRHVAVLKAAAEKSGWVSRVGPTRNDGKGLLRGRGIAYALRNGALAAIVAEVEVDRTTGAWRATRFVVAHDCGMVINPRSLERVIESNVLMSLSRSRHEEVRFDATRVTSVDWASYPILDMTEIPDAIDVVLVGNRAGKSYGAGEPSTRPIAAALGNALFDATGVRLRRVPFTPARLLAAIGAGASVG